MIAYVVVLEGELDDAAINARYGLRPAWAGGGILPGAYETGSLIVDVFDGRSMLPLWRGTIRANIPPELSEELRRQRVTNAGATVLSAFSPGGS
jgi:hypothetical protein